MSLSLLSERERFDIIENSNRRWFKKISKHHGCFGFPKAKFRIDIDLVSLYCLLLRIGKFEGSQAITTGGQIKTFLIYYKLAKIMATDVNQEDTELTDDALLSKLAQADPREFQPQFSLKDLVGKTIQEHRQIEYRLFRTPREDDLDDPHNDYRYPPENLDAIIFTDATFLVTEHRGNGESGHLGSYYWNGIEMLYSDQLFGV